MAKQFRAIVAWPGDKSIFQEEEEPTDAQGDGGRVEEDEDMAYLVDYFIGGEVMPQP